MSTIGNIFSICLILWISAFVYVNGATDNTLRLDLNDSKKKYISGEVATFTLDVSNPVDINVGDELYLIPTNIDNIEITSTHCKGLENNVFDIKYDADARYYVFSAIEPLMSDCQFEAKLIYTSLTSTKYDQPESYSLTAFGMGLSPSTVNWSNSIFSAYVSFLHVNSTMNEKGYEDKGKVAFDNLYNVQIQVEADLYSIAGKTIVFSNDYSYGTTYSSRNGSPAVMAYTYSESECVTDDGVVLGDVSGQAFTITSNNFKVLNAFTLTFKDIPLTQNAAFVACNVQVKFKPIIHPNEEGVDTITLGLLSDQTRKVIRHTDSEIFPSFILKNEFNYLITELQFTTPPPPPPHYPPKTIWKSSSFNSTDSSYSTSNVEIMTSKEFDIYKEKHKDNELKQAATVTHVTTNSPITLIKLEPAIASNSLQSFGSDIRITLAVKVGDTIEDIEHDFSMSLDKEYKIYASIVPIYPREYSTPFTLFFRMSSLTDIYPYNIFWYVDDEEVYKSTMRGSIGTAVVVDVPKFSSNLVRPDLHSSFLDYNTLLNPRALIKDISFTTSEQLCIKGHQYGQLVESPSPKTQISDFFYKDYISKSDMTPITLRLADGQCYHKKQFKTQFLSFDLSKIEDFGVSSKDGVLPIFKSSIIDPSTLVDRNLYFKLEVSTNSLADSTASIDFKNFPISFVGCTFDNCETCQAKLTTPSEVTLELALTNTLFSTLYHDIICQFTLLPEDEITNKNGFIRLAYTTNTRLGKKVTRDTKTYFIKSETNSDNSVANKDNSIIPKPISNSEHVVHSNFKSMGNSNSVVSEDNSKSEFIPTYTLKLAFVPNNYVRYNNLVPRLYTKYAEYHKVITFDMRVIEHVPYDALKNKFFNITFLIVDEVGIEEELHEIIEKMTTSFTDTSDIEFDVVELTRLPEGRPVDYEPTCESKFLPWGQYCENDSDCINCCLNNECWDTCPNTDNDDNSSFEHTSTWLCLIFGVLVFVFQF